MAENVYNYSDSEKTSFFSVTELLAESWRGEKLLD